MDGELRQRRGTMTDTPTTTRVQVPNGRPFTVRIVREGDRYGRGDCLIHDEDEAMVEFYDATYANNGRFGPHGQFVSRYYISTLLESPHRGRGLGLCGHEPAWTIDAGTMETVYEFISEEM